MRGGSLVELRRRDGGGAASEGCRRPRRSGGERVSREGIGLFGAEGIGGEGQQVRRVEVRRKLEADGWAAAGGVMTVKVIGREPTQ